MKRRRNSLSSLASPSLAAGGAPPLYAAAVLGLLLAVGGSTGGGLGGGCCWAFDVRTSAPRKNAPGRRLPVASAVSFDGIAAASSSSSPRRSNVLSPLLDPTDAKAASLPKELLAPLPAELSRQSMPPSLLLDGIQSDVWPVLSAALLVTGNTVGAGCLVLPELAAGPGIALSSLVFGGSYLLNLLSGLTIARIAVERHRKETNEYDGGGESAQSSSSSSFQDLARSALGDGAGTLVSAVSLLVNAAVLCFDLGQVGREVGDHLLFGQAGGSGALLAGPAASAAFAAAVGAVLAKLPPRRVSDVASACAAVLFASFGGLLVSGSGGAAADLSGFDLYGLLSSKLFSPETSPIDSASTWGSLGQAAPVIFMSMVYQNIVPSVVKVLDYDMARVTSALSLGSFLPLCLYLVWCAVGTASVSCPSPIFLALFTASTLVGSALGTGMSLVEEVQALRASGGSAAPGVFVGAGDGTAAEADSSSPPRPHWGSVAVGFGLPLAAALALGQDRAVEALEWAGSFGSPLLYGVLPAAMALRQRQRNGREQERGQGDQGSVPWHGLARSDSEQRPPFVYSLPSLGVLGVLSTGFIGEELVHQVSSLAS